MAAPLKVRSPGPGVRGAKASTSTGPKPDTLEARLHDAPTLSLNYIRRVHIPCGLHEVLLDHADEAETMARGSSWRGPMGVFPAEELGVSHGIEGHHQAYRCGQGLRLHRRRVGA